MNDARVGLWPIGSFASAAQLSLKALRLYDQLGLLKPTVIDPDSGYRYYHVDQLHEARLIRMLRQIDMPLASIRLVLAAPPAQAEALVRDHVQQMEQRLAQARHAVQGVLAYLRHEENVIMDVQVRAVEAQPIISVTTRVKVDQLSDTIRSSLDQLYAVLQAQGVRSAGAPFGIYHGPINEEEDGPIEICVPVTGAVTVDGEMKAGKLPAGQVAAVQLHGDECEFPKVLSGYDATFDWIKQHGYEHAGSPREVWISAAGMDNAEEDRIEIAWPFHQKAT